MKNIFLRKSFGVKDDGLKNILNRNYNRPDNRYDERTYGREEKYYRDPADTRYNSNYNSYRGNGNITNYISHCFITLC